MAHFVQHAALTPAALRSACQRLTAHTGAHRGDVRHLSARVRAHLPFALYAVATFAAMAYILDLLCSAGI